MTTEVSGVSGVTQVRMHAEYECWPLWWTAADGAEVNPDPHDFAREAGLPADLAQALADWSDEFDAAVDPEDFSKPLFGDAESAAAFDRRGLDLARRVAAALGDRWSVRYSSATTGPVEL